MNQITLDVRLFAENEDDDILAFLFDDEELRVNLNLDSCQGELKAIFSKLIGLIIENDVTLRLVIDPNFTRVLYKDVCSEYIDDLQNELNSVKETIRKELGVE